MPAVSTLMVEEVLLASLSPPPTSPPSAASDGSSSGGAIGVAVGGVAGAILLAGAAWFACNRRKVKQGSHVEMHTEANVVRNFA